MEAFVPSYSVGSSTFSRLCCLIASHIEEASDKKYMQLAPHALIWKFRFKLHHEVTFRIQSNEFTTCVQSYVPRYASVLWELPVMSPIG